LNAVFREPNCFTSVSASLVRCRHAVETMNAHSYFEIAIRLLRLNTVGQIENYLVKGARDQINTRNGADGAGISGLLYFHEPA
jgi:hypothetical protein